MKSLTLADRRRIAKRAWKAIISRMDGENEYQRPCDVESCVEINRRRSERQWEETVMLVGVGAGAGGGGGGGG